MIHLEGGEQLSKTKIAIEDNGPYKISGSFELIDAEGNVYKNEKSISLCRCGYSNHKPFCDRTHEEVNFESKPRAKDHKLMVEV